MAPQRGFTLVEILVVIVIIGIMASVVVLNTGGDAQRLLKQDAQRLRAVLQLAAEEAELQAKEYGLVIDKHSYQIVEFDERRRQWHAVDTPAFAVHKVSESSVLSLQSEGEMLDLTGDLAKELSQQDKNKAANGQLRPALLLLSSGETSAFELILQGAGSTNPGYRLSSDGFSDIQLDRIND